MNVIFPLPVPLWYEPLSVESYWIPPFRKYAMRSVPGQYWTFAAVPSGARHVWTEPPGSACVAPDVDTACAIGRSGLLTVHVPPTLLMIGKPNSVSIPPGSVDLNMDLTEALPFRVRSLMLFSLLRIEWQSAVQPPP